MMIIDGHAHLYADESAQKIIDKFTEFHKMNPKSGIGKGTFSDLQQKMEQSSTNYTVKQILLQSKVFQEQMNGH